jgi:hypothetical protein
MPKSPALADASNHRSVFRFALFEGDPRYSAIADIEKRVTSRAAVKSNGFLNQNNVLR